LIGVLDTGEVQGLTMSPFQQHHFLINVYDTFGRYKPPVPHSLVKVNFVPVIEPGQKVYEKPNDSLLQPMGLDPSFQHEFRSRKFCWCDAAAKAAMDHGLFYPHWIIELQIASLDSSEMLNISKDLKWENKQANFISEDGISYKRLSVTNAKLV